MTNALIIGSDGQDGTLLQEYLSQKSVSLTCIDKSFIFKGYNFDITNQMQVHDLIKTNNYNEIYFLAAYHGSSEQKKLTSNLKMYVDINTKALLNFLESIRLYSRSTKLFYANSSFVFGKSTTPKLDESSTKTPICNYGHSKLLAYQMINFYRYKFNIFAVNGILFNHESLLRPDSFVSKKIIKSAFSISHGASEKLELGNLKQLVDWGYARDYIEAFVLTLNSDKADDYIISSGELHSIEEFCKIVFDHFGLDYKNHVVENKQYVTNDRGILFGNPEKIFKELKWKPKHSFEQWVKLLCYNYKR